MENVGGRQEDVQSAFSQPHAFLLLAALLGGNIALALGAWFVRLADTGPVATGFWRLLLALPFFLVLARLNRERPFTLGWRKIALVGIAGLFFAGDMASWHVGIGLTRLSNAVLFANSGSLVLMVWGFVVLAMWPRFREWAAIGMALTGAVILLGRSAEISSDTLVGDLFSLLAGLLYAGYLLILQDARKTVGGWSLLFWSGAAGAVFLLALALALGEVIWPTDWLPIFALVLVSQVIGQGLLVYSLGHFPPLIIGLALLTQPAVAATVGFLAYGEVLTALDFAGMGLLGAALVVARASRERG